MGKTGISSSKSNQIFGDNEYAYITMSADQTTDIAATNPIKFNTLSSGNVTFDQATYRVTLKKNRTYRLEAGTEDGYSDNTGEVAYGFYNVTAGAYIGVKADKYPNTATSNNSGSQKATATITPTVDTVIEVRIYYVSAFTMFSAVYCYWEIQQINIYSPILQQPYELLGTPKFYAGNPLTWPSYTSDSTTVYEKNGHIFCNGASLLITKYQDLYAELGTIWNTCAKQDGTGGNYSAPSAGYFRIPDLRGVFLRGAGISSLADGSGDVTVTLGAFTDDKFQGHWHDQYAQTGGSDSAWTYAGTQGSTGSTHLQSQKQVQSPITDGTNGTPRTGLETAPRNVGMNYVIKATY